MALMETLVDSFNQGVGANWTTSGSADGTQVVGKYDALYITHTAASQYNQLGPSATYDLTGSYCYVQIKDFGDQTIASHEVLLQVYKDSTNSVFFSASGNFLSWQRVVGTQQFIGGVTLDQNLHRWLQIRESGGTTFWETSPDGVTWTTQYSEANPIVYTSVVALMRCGCYAAETRGSYAIFDNFNTPDPSPYSYRPVQIANPNVGPMALRQTLRGKLHYRAQAFDVLVPAAAAEGQFFAVF